MKTPYQVQQEIARIERLIPHLISDQGERAEEILGFHVASLYASAPTSEHGLIRERVRHMQGRCREAANASDAAGLPLMAAAQPQWA
ncbi:hypothetical protein BV378_14390 [Nostoc sp. RF31YmG]|jgi:hypothetical protein|nr:hypothetical protein BV378_14390 [Nostoc sp. RF31YmG]